MAMLNNQRVEKVHPAVGRKIAQQMVEITLSNLYAWQAARNRMHMFSWREMKFGSQLHSMLGHGLKKIIPETNRSATNSEPPQLVPTTVFTYRVPGICLGERSIFVVELPMFSAESTSWAPPKQGSRWSPTSFRMTSLGTAARPGCQTTWEWIKIWLTQEATDLNIFLIEKRIYLLKYPILIHTHVAFGILKIPFRFLDSKPFLGFQVRL